MAATKNGTRRRRAMEITTIDRVAKQARPDLPASARRRAVLELHKRATRGRS